jgi:hypothetical protein
MKGFSLGLRYYPDIFMAGLRNVTKTLNQIAGVLAEIRKKTSGIQFRSVLACVILLGDSVSERGRSQNTFFFFY